MQTFLKVMIESLVAMSFESTEFEMKKGGHSVLSLEIILAEHWNINGPIHVKEGMMESATTIPLTSPLIRVEAFFFKSLGFGVFVCFGVKERG